MTLVLDFADFAHCSWAVSQKRFFLVGGFAARCALPQFSTRGRTPYISKARGLPRAVDSNFLGALQQELLHCNKYHN
jgi:hypothetical protein